MRLRRISKANWGDGRDGIIFFPVVNIKLRAYMSYINMSQLFLKKKKKSAFSDPSVVLGKELCYFKGAFYSSP